MDFLMHRLIGDILQSMTQKRVQTSGSGDQDNDASDEGNSAECPHEARLRALSDEY